MTGFIVRQLFRQGRDQAFATHMIGCQPDGFDVLNELRLLVARYPPRPRFSPGSHAGGLVQFTNGVFALIATHRAKLIQNTSFFLLAGFLVAHLNLPKIRLLFGKRSWQ